MYCNVVNNHHFVKVIGASLRKPTLGNQYCNHSIMYHYNYYVITHVLFNHMGNMACSI